MAIPHIFPFKSDLQINMIEHVLNRQMKLTQSSEELQSVWSGTSEGGIRLFGKGTGRGAAPCCQGQVRKATRKLYRIYPNLSKSNGFAQFLRRSTVSICTLTLFLDAPCLGQVVSTLSARGREMVSWRCWRHLATDWHGSAGFVEKCWGEAAEWVDSTWWDMITPHLDTFWRNRGIQKQNWQNGYFLFPGIALECLSQRAIAVVLEAARMFEVWPLSYIGKEPSPKFRMEDAVKK